MQRSQGLLGGDPRTGNVPIFGWSSFSLVSSDKRESSHMALRATGNKKSDHLSSGMDKRIRKKKILEKNGGAELNHRESLKKELPSIS